MTMSPYRWLTPHDWNRSYLLPDTVDSNIPRRGGLGEPGAWNVARGLLVELCRALAATPISLRYQELETRRSRAPIGIRVTAAALRDHRRVTAIYRRENAPYSTRGDYWLLTVNGLLDPDGEGVHPPSLPRIATIARRTLDRELPA
ncbi:hypothetical protein L3Q67_01725 [Saccharothrix sp. AJ9571]|nr:hypothetical protein L3Q67_01725 [Saccharothrix sp. AJ9571]